MKAEHVGGEADFPRENNFNFLRFALAVLVLFSHSFSLIHGGDRWDWLYILTRGQVFGGGLAVDGFFIISGSLILQSWLRSLSAGDYLRKRALRIYPGYLVCALLCIFVVGPIASGGASIFFHHNALEAQSGSASILGVFTAGAFHPFAVFFCKWGFVDNLCRIHLLSNGGGIGVGGDISQAAYCAGAGNGCVGAL